MVGARGFEPPTSASRTQRSSQAEPRSDIIKVIVEVRDLYNSIKKLKSNLKSNKNYFFNDMTTFFKEPSPSLTVVISGSSCKVI